MARASATWTNTEATHWIAGQYIRLTRFLQQVLQNIEFLGQSHDHNGDPGDGGTLAVADAKAVEYYNDITWGGPFG